MNFLLDTHSLIWFIIGDDRLPKKSQTLIKNIDNKCFVSIASIWEIAVKVSLKKLDLNGSFEDLAQSIIENDIELLPISMEHIAELISLEYFHRDPFDRLIIAQAITVKMLR